MAALVFEIGEVLHGTYVIRALVGEGGMGQVFEADDRVLQRSVAIKAMARPTVGGVSLLALEARALAAVRHQALAAVHFFGIHRGVEYLVMERIFGVSLEEHLCQRAADGGLLSVEEVVDTLLLIAKGLSALHGAGVVHRDVKPANVMLTPQNRVVLVNLGIVLPEIHADRSGPVAGTPAYMAPETIRNDFDAVHAHLIDLYALGVVAYEMLTGNVPFRAQAASQVLHQHLQSLPTPVGYLRPDTPPRLAALVHELLAKQPLDRPDSAETVVWRLGTVLTHEHRGPATLSVLIVDDDPDCAGIVRMAVKHVQPAAEVRLALDAAQALRMVRARAPDLLLVNLRMPGMSGVELCMYLRGAGLCAECQIVAVSSGVKAADLAVLRALGVSEYVEKGPELVRRLGPIVRKAAHVGRLRIR